MCCAKHLFSFTKAASMQPDPVISRLRPDRHFGSISEHINKLIDNYMSANPDKVLTDIFSPFLLLTDSYKTKVLCHCVHADLISEKCKFLSHQKMCDI